MANGFFREKIGFVEGQPTKQLHGAARAQAIVKLKRANFLMSHPPPGCCGSCSLLRLHRKGRRALRAAAAGLKIGWFLKTPIRQPRYLKL
jgi:hypothetical protein